jgi:hypothetical protein
MEAGRHVQSAYHLGELGQEGYGTEEDCREGLDAMVPEAGL